MITHLNRLVKKNARRLKRFLADESGPTAVEYAMMIALILTGLILAANALTTEARQVFEEVGEELATSSKN